MNIKLIIILIFSSISLYSFADADIDYYLVEEFKKTFSSHYTEGRCGDNILRLLNRAESKNIKIENAKILEITNQGFSLFGLINAEFARQSYREPTETNWYHHVILEQDGHIIDYDFGNIPVVLPVKEYFEKMFLNDKKGTSGHYIGRDEKLKTYEILERPALETILARQNRKPVPELKKSRLIDYLKSF